MYLDNLASRVSLGVFEYNCVEKQIFTHCHILGSGKCKQKNILLGCILYNLICLNLSELCFKNEIIEQLIAAFYKQ